MKMAQEEVLGQAGGQLVTPRHNGPIEQDALEREIELTLLRFQDVKHF